MLNKGNDPEKAQSCSPICPLSALNKVTKQLIKNRIVHHLKSKGWDSIRQYGFQEGISTKHTIEYTIDYVRWTRGSGKYSTVVSFDIKGAQDYMSWMHIYRQLEMYKLLVRIRKLIVNYLYDRNVTYFNSNPREGLKVVKG